MALSYILDTEAVEDGKNRPITVDGVPLLVCHSQGEFYVIRNQCSHAAARLTGGKLRGCKIFCPLHSAAFDLRTGAALSPPATDPIETYTCTIDNGKLYVDLPDEQQRNAG